MTKNRKKVGAGDIPDTLVSTSSGPEQKLSKPPKTKPPQPSISALIICRNKHWRYISSFHGPWLQLPPEVLESLANNNYALPRPRPIDPAVFFDLLKIRRLVDDATNFAVRAANGTASLGLQSHMNAGNGLLGSSGTPLGVGLGGGGGNAKLSRERKHRMREQATQKLSKAYHLDEIATSVAMMQAASSLEDVAHLVLQRSPTDIDAKYVHFFHEKIPSRHLAECTSLESLDEIIAERPGQGEPQRTRAVTKIFKDDFVGAAQDFTMALKLCRFYQGQHKSSRQELQLASVAAAEAQKGSRWKEEVKLDDEDHPSSLETQLLFHRAGVYLATACQHVSAALPPKSSRKTTHEASGKSDVDGETSSESVEATPAEQEAKKKRMEARKLVKTNAKRALRDYNSFLSHFDYNPGLSAEAAEDYVRKMNQAASGLRVPRPKYSGQVLEMDGNTSLSNGQLSDALVPHVASRSSKYRAQNGSNRAGELPSLPPPTIYQISSLFSATLPMNLPSYPEIVTALSVKPKGAAPQVNHASQSLLAYAHAESHEALTYHPLLTDALHSLLLCHCLIQTSARELQRHAHMVARLARICDGYPVFQAARSPSRADWIEIIRRGDNWINLSQSWEALCAPAPLPGQSNGNQQKETPEQKHERMNQQAIMEALEDDRVHDEASFHATVQARQRLHEEEEKGKTPKRWAQEDGREYPISTERAEAIVRWVSEAPVGSDATGMRKKKKGPKGSVKKDLNGEMSGLKVEEDGECFEPVEEEVD